MFKKKGVILVAVVVLVSAFVYYRFTTKVLAPVPSDDSSVQANKVTAAKPAEPTNTPKETVQAVTAPAASPKEVSATVKYSPTEDFEADLRIVIKVDENGVITGARTYEDTTNTVAQQKNSEFSDALWMTIKGKKLSELNKIDKIASSTLTTNAFNGTLEQLKAQL